MNKAKSVNYFKTTAKYMFILCITAIMLFPFYWMFITAVKPVSEVFAFPPKLWPGEFHFENFLEAIRRDNVFNMFKNSAIVTTVATTITVFINLLAGFAFAKYKFKGKEVMFMIVLSTLMIPVK